MSSPPYWSVQNNLKVSLVIDSFVQEIEAKELKLQQEKQEYTADIILKSQFNKSKVKVITSSLPFLPNYLFIVFLVYFCTQSSTKL